MPKIIVFADCRSSDATPRDLGTPTQLNEVENEENIADEIQAKLASIKGLDSFKFLLKNEAEMRPFFLRAI